MRVAVKVTDVVPPEEIQRLLRELEGPSKSFHLSDMGNAERLIHYHGKNIRYCHPWGRWLIWDGCRWKADDTAAIARLARDTVRRIYTEASREVDEKERKALAAHAMRSEANGKIKAMVDLAASEEGVPVLPADLDNEPWLFNCLNGTLDLRTGELRPHRRDDLLTKLAPVEFDPDAQAPRWEEFLDRVMAGNRQLIEFIKRAAGYSLTGRTSEQKFFFVHGTGGNGKSRFMKPLQTSLTGMTWNTQ